MISPGSNFEAFGIEMGQRRMVPSVAMSDPALMAEFMVLTARYGIEMLPPTK